MMLVPASCRMKTPPPIPYDDFVQRVRRYQRTSVLIACTQVGWRAWSLREKSGLNVSPPTPSVPRS